MDDDYDPQKRIAYLEEEVARLRVAAGEADAGQPAVAPWLNLGEFDRSLKRMSNLSGAVFFVIFATMMAGFFLAVFRPGVLPDLRFGSVPLLNFGRQFVGVISMGGLAVGIFAFGGLAVGVVAYGGGSIGLVALGGGAVGVFAYGGGAVGYVAVGGSAYGRWVLAQKGGGGYVLARNRQDEEAAAFFRRWLPGWVGLGRAVGRPTPVVMPASR